MKRKYPVCIHGLENICREEYLYVDNTPLISQMITIMKKTIILSVMLLLLPMMAIGQAADGVVKRPVKKQHKASMQQVNKNNGTKATSEKSMSGKTELKPTIQHQLPSTTPFVIQSLVKNMVFVEGGTFLMGATPEQDSDPFPVEKPVHYVTLSSYSIGKYEVTQEEWLAVMDVNPSYVKGDKFPVEEVSWEECQLFIRKLNNMTGMHFRLPTEAEWEYAARGGNRSRGYKYAGSNDLTNVAWYDGNSGHKTHEVGRKRPNELGLYDMSGNVWEWCQDWQDDYVNDSQRNPTGPSSGTDRIRRGGSWDSFARFCRSSCRDLYAPTFRSHNLGLRLAL